VRVARSSSCTCWRPNGRSPVSCSLRETSSRSPAGCTSSRDQVCSPPVSCRVAPSRVTWWSWAWSRPQGQRSEVAVRRSMPSSSGSGSSDRLNTSEPSGSQEKPPRFSSPRISRRGGSSPVRTHSVEPSSSGVCHAVWAPSQDQVSDETGDSRRRTRAPVLTSRSSVHRVRCSAGTAGVTSCTAIRVPSGRSWSRSMAGRWRRASRSRGCSGRRSSVTGASSSVVRDRATRHGTAPRVAVCTSTRWAPGGSGTVPSAGSSPRSRPSVATTCTPSTHTRAAWAVSRLRLTSLNRSLRTVAAAHATAGPSVRSRTRAPRLVGLAVQVRRPSARRTVSPAAGQVGVGPRPGPPSSSSAAVASSTKAGAGRGTGPSTSQASGVSSAPTAMAAQRNRDMTGPRSGLRVGRRI
jgi:hypothetical protein